MGRCAGADGAGSVMMKYSRDADTEADMVGAQIMYDAGYNPEGARQGGWIGSANQPLLKMVST